MKELIDLSMIKQDREKRQQEIFYWRFNEFEATFKNAESRLNDIPVINKNLMKMKADFLVMTSEFKSAASQNNQINSRIKNHDDATKIKLQIMKDDLEKMSTIVYKPSDTDEKIMNVYDQCTNRMK